MKFEEKFCAAIMTALLIAGLPVVDASGAGRRVPTRLRSGDGIGYIVTYYDDQNHYHSGDILVSIDGRNLSEFKRREIEALLHPPPIGDITLETMTAKGTLQTVKLPRMETSTIWPRWGIQTEHIDSANDHGWNSGTAADSIDIEARAQQGLLLRKARAWQKDAPALSTAAYPAALTNYWLGNFNAADQLLVLAEKTYTTGNWMLTQNVNAAAAVETLLAVGRQDHAEHLIQMVADGDGRRQWNYVEPLLRVLALRRAGANPASAIDLMNRFAGKLTQPSLWMAHINLLAGDYSRAESICRDLQKRNGAAGDQWQQFDQFGKTQYELALTQDWLGNYSDAASTLHDAIKQMHASLSDEQIAVIERAPGTFPRLSDFTTALDLVEAQKKIPIESVSIFAEPHPNAFSAVRKCHEAIEARNQRDAKVAFEALLQAYPSTVRDGLDAEHAPNLYCAMVNLAREASDRGWIILSNEMLRKISSLAEGKDANPVAKALLQAEFVYNASKSKKISDADWEKLDQSLHGTSAPTTRDFAFSERLRRLAILFYYADEISRAQLFIGKALEQSEQGDAVKQSVMSRNPQSDKTLIILDAACIALANGDTQQANAYRDQVLSRQRDASSSYGGTVIELAAAYEKIGRRADAIAFLQAIHEKPSDVRLYQVSNGVTAVDLELARFLLADGKAKEACDIALAAAAKVPQRMSLEQTLIVAHSAESAGRFAEAAEFYSQCMFGGGGPSGFRTAGMPDYSEKAIELAERTPGFDRIKLATIYLQWLQNSRPTSPEARLRGYKRVAELLPENDSRKAEALKQLSFLEKHDATKYEADLPLLRRAAEVAESTKKFDVVKVWMELAVQQVLQGHKQEGVASAQHGLQLFDHQNAKNHDDPLGFGHGIVRILAAHGGAADAEQLLQKAISRVKAVSGEKSVVTQAELTDLFEFYIDQKQFSKALSVLDEILNCDLTNGETPSQAMTHSHCGGWPHYGDANEVLGQIFNLATKVAKSNPDVARPILQKVLAAQLKQLKRNDERFTVTYANLGDLLYGEGNYEQAAPYFETAYALAKLYHKGEFALRMAGKHYINNLEKLNKVDEAKRLKALEFEGVGPPASNQ